MNINREILNLIIDGKDPFSVCNLCESKIINETYKCLMESIVNWMYIQVQLVKDLINNPVVESWGHGFDSEGLDWSSYDMKTKQLMLMKFLEKTGILAKLRDYMNSDGNIIRTGTNEYDIKNIQQDFKSPTFLSEFRQTKIYQELIEMCLEGLKTGVSA